LNIIEHCRPWIEDALAYSGGTHTFEDVEQRILESHLQLWPAERGCAVTEIVIYPRKKVLHVFLGGRRNGSDYRHDRQRRAWSKTQGCTSMTIAGRHGWRRVLEKYGYKPVLTVLEKEFE
jgi:hypothetical protein